jgi:hypothetical protein
MDLVKSGRPMMGRPLFVYPRSVPPSFKEDE